MHCYQSRSHHIQRSVLAVAGCVGSCVWTESCPADIDFDAAVEILADGEVTEIATGDLEGDGDIDAIALIPGDLVEPGSIQAFINEGLDGNGDWLGFTATTAVIVAPGETTALAVGLFDSDQLLAAVAIADNGRPPGDVVQTRRWNPDRETFENHQSIGLVDRPSAVKLAHFDDDGILDLAVALENNNEVLVIFGSGGGFFDPGDTEQAAAGGFQPTGIEPECLIGGLKGADIAGTNREQLGPGSPGQVFVLSNNGPLGFGDPLLFEVGVDPTGLSVGDLNVDGFLDIVVSNGGDGTFSFLLNDAGTTFDEQVMWPAGASPIAIVAADLDNDGDGDVVVVADDMQGNPTVRVLENLIFLDVVFFAGPLELSVAATPNTIISADINLDGIQDLITGNLDDGTVPAGSISVLINTTPVLELGDINGDGVVDFFDLILLLGAWGPCGDCGACPEDLDGDCIVATPDLLILLGNWD